MTASAHAIPLLSVLIADVKPNNVGWVNLIHQLVNAIVMVPPHVETTDIAILPKNANVNVRLDTVANCVKSLMLIKYASDFPATQ